jgi:uncharacterized protein (UPF0332 family)
MPKKEHHIAQANSNLEFLEKIWQFEHHDDWKVTVTFYSALHIINAHLADKGFDFRKHIDVDHAINFANTMSTARLPEKEYLAYKKLSVLSRISRYMVSSDSPSHSRVLIKTKHVAKAQKNLKTIIAHFVHKGFEIKALSLTGLQTKNS